MKVKNLVGERFKETPADCVIPSHIFMLRGGYIKYVANGIFSLLPPMKRIVNKIENIIREEMDNIDSQEVLFPVVLPADLWKESGRYDTVGKELLRFTDRNNKKMVLGMTHEEAAVQLVREYGQSYQRYPFAVYQIQTKFRDEARSRGGLIRVREFTMKDAYSFHTSQENLEKHYERYHHAYERIYKRAGLNRVVSVAADAGMMGGNISHEFIYLTPVGEDSIAMCKNCDFKSNVEAAENIIANKKNKEKMLEKIYTPNKKTIEEISDFFDVDTKDICKAVAYKRISDEKPIIIFLRGDMEINETKLENLVGEDIYPISIEESTDIVFGFIGPINLNFEAVVFYDNSLKGANNLICGSNEDNYHYKGLSINRDLPNISYVDISKIGEDSLCPKCQNKSIEISKGIEVGNIFQLGDKYTKSMKMTYLDEEGETKFPVVGCYGIGVGRLAASVVEAHNDLNGPIWPISISPWQVQICCLRADNMKVKMIADEIYDDLQKKGIEVLYDDRVVSAGVMFSDADLFGIPLRIIISPRNIENQKIEIISRDKKIKETAPTDNIVESVIKIVESLQGQFEV